MRSSLRVAFTACPVHIRAADVPNVVQEEGKPQPRVKRDAVQLCPSNSDHDGMEKKLVSSKQDAP
jgi:hypothetical protein